MSRTFIPTKKGVYGSAVVENDIDARVSETHPITQKLTANTAVGETRVFVDNVPTYNTVGSWIYIDAYTTQCEVRKVASVDRVNGIVTFSTALAYAHAIDDCAFITDPGTMNVRWFGARGDNSTDDTAAFTGMATELPKIGGGTAYIPSGIYKCSSKITWPTHLCGLIVRGDGAATIVRYTAVDATDCWLFEEWYTAGPQPFTYSYGIYDLVLEGAGVGTNTGNAIVIKNVMNWIIQNVHVHYFGGGAGLYFEGVQSSNVISYTGSYNKYALYTKHASGTMTHSGLAALATQNVNFLADKFEGSADYGVYCENIANATFENSVMQGNGKGGIYIAAGSHIMLSGLYLEANEGTTYWDIHAVTGSYLTIMNCIDVLGGTPPGANYKVLHIDNTYGRSIIENNNFQGVVHIHGNYNFLFGSKFTECDGYTALLGGSAYTACTANDATPSVSRGDAYDFYRYYTQNTNPTTITSLDDGIEGQVVYIYVADAVTTFDFSSSVLRGNDGVDYAAAQDDVIRAIKVGNNWYCEIIKA